MIIKGGGGGKGGHAGALAKHLMRTDENDRVEIMEIDPAAPSEDLHAILSEFQMLAQVRSQGEIGFYQASINPQSDDRPLSPEEWKQAADILEKKLGFDGQPRVIVLHEKEGREHIHVVWQRYDTESGKLRTYNQNYKAHMEAAREIEQTLDLHRFQDIVQDRSHDFPETQQSARTDMTVKERKALITGLYQRSDSSDAFVAGLSNAGFDLARGDKANTFVVIDHHGEVHSLVRQIDGAKKAEIHDKLLPREPRHFKSVAEIKAERHYEPAPDLRSEDRARDEIASQFAEERLALEARHAQERDNQKREFEAQNRALAEKRGLKMVGQEMKRRSNFGRPIVKQPIRAQNLKWWREDQTRLSRQKVAFDRLIKQQANELAKLGREEARALAEHDRQGRSGERPVHAKSLEDRLLQTAREALDSLHRDDRSPNSPIAWHNRQLATLDRQRQGDERRLVTYLNNQEQAKTMFRAAYKDAEAAYGAFRDHARTHGLKSAQNALVSRPDRFGEAKAPPSLSDVEQAAPALRSVHYTEKKMFDVRLRVEDRPDIPALMAEHGVEGDAWRHRADAREENLNRQIGAHRQAIVDAREKPDDRRLVLMDAARAAASKLDSDTYAKLPQRSRNQLHQIRKTLRDPTYQSRLAELRRRQDDLDRARDVLGRARGDPWHHQ